MKTNTSRIRLLIVSSIVAFVAACATSPSTPQPTEAQLRAAARYGLTAMEENGLDLHDADVLRAGDWHACIDTIHAARSLLYPSGAAKIDPADVQKALAIARSAVRTGRAAWVLANAAEIDDERAAKYEEEGLAMDGAFDAYVKAHPD